LAGPWPLPAVTRARWLCWTRPSGRWRWRRCYSRVSSSRGRRGRSLVADGIVHVQRGGAGPARSKHALDLSLDWDARLAQAPQCVWPPHHPDQSWDGERAHQNEATEDLIGRVPGRRAVDGSAAGSAAQVRRSATKGATRRNMVAPSGVGCRPGPQPSSPGRLVHEARPRYGQDGNAARQAGLVLPVARQVAGCATGSV
jgi:hypothetical protein